MKKFFDMWFGIFVLLLIFAGYIVMGLVIATRLIDFNPAVGIIAGCAHLAIGIDTYLWLSGQDL